MLPQNYTPLHLQVLHCSAVTLNLTEVPWTPHNHNRRKNQVQSRSQVVNNSLDHSSCLVLVDHSRLHQLLPPVQFVSDEAVTILHHLLHSSQWCWWHQPPPDWSRVPPVPLWCVAVLVGPPGPDLRSSPAAQEDPLLYSPTAAGRLRRIKKYRHTFKKTSCCCWMFTIRKRHFQIISTSFHFPWLQGFYIFVWYTWSHFLVMPSCSLCRDKLSQFLNSIHKFYVTISNFY